MSEFNARLERARAKLPLTVLMAQHGDGARAGNWKKFPCPFCNKPGHDASVKPYKGTDFFKCFHDSCPSGTAVAKGAWDAIGYLGFKLHLNRTDACKEFMKMAGEWKEGAPAPSVMPGSQRRKTVLPKELQPKTVPADSLPGSTESRSTDDERPVDFEPEFNVAENAEPTGGTPVGATGTVALPDPEVELLRNCVEVIRSEQKASISLLQRRLKLGYARAARFMEALERAGLVGPSRGSEPREILNLDLPLTPASLPPVAGGASPAGDAHDLVTGRSDGENRQEAPGRRSSKHSSSSGSADSGAARTNSPASGGPSAPGAGAPGEGSAGKTDQRDAGGTLPGDDLRVRSLREQGLDCLRRFYEQLTISDADLWELWTKRGLTVETCERAGFRTNDQPNFPILSALANEFAEDVLLESGLWQARCQRCRKTESNCKCKQQADIRVAQNAQFYGFGLVGKKPREERKHDDDDTVWGWKAEGKCNPLLIPYFDAAGALVHLRPHKGGMEGRGSMFYVCRRQGAPDAGCSTAFITEGEFKSRAQEQVLTFGGRRVAAGAIPGIQQAKTFEMMEQIRDWLEGLHVETVLVGYDNEEKCDPKLTHSFQPDPKERYDAVIWARYLAVALGRDWAARVCTLPNAWRNAKGKADWDGVLAARLAEFQKGEAK